MRYIIFLLLFPVFLFPLPAQAQAQKGSAYSDYAVFAFEEGDYEEAEKNLRIALQFDPENPEYHYRLGKVHLENRDFASAKAEFETARAAAPDLPGLYYDTGLLYFRSGEYAKAAEIFQTLLEKSPEDAQMLYYAGLSLSKSRQCGKAEEYLLKAAQISPSLRSHNDFLIRECVADSVQKKTDPEKNPETGASGETADEPVEKVLSSDRNPHSIHFLLSRIYEDNVRLEPEDLDGGAGEGDWATGVYLSGTYDFLDRNRFRVGSGLDYFHTFYDDLSEFEQKGSVFRVYTSYEYNPLIFGFNYMLFYHWLDSESALRRHRIGPDITWKAGDDLMLRFSYVWYDNADFMDEFRSGHSNKVLMKLYYRLPDRKSRIYAGLEYEKNSASLSEESFDRLKMKIGASLKLPWKLELDMNGIYADREYDGMDTAYEVCRNDEKYSASFSLSRTIWYDRLRLIAEYSHTRNNSNIPDSEYRQNRAGISLAITY